MRKGTKIYENMPDFMAMKIFVQGLVFRIKISTPDIKQATRDKPNQRSDR
jgi:hypothetical protein